MENPTITVTICGGGNGAHTAAGYLSAKFGYCVNVLTRRPKDWSKTITVITTDSSWEYRGTFVGTLNCVTDDPSEVIPNSDIVIVAAPSHTHTNILKKVYPYLTENMIVGTIYAQGGFDWAVMNVFGGDISKVKAVFGLQNIPWLCRLCEYGKRVQILGPKKALWVATMPIEKSNEISKILALLFDIPTVVVPNFLSLTLTPSNQIIHPARYYGIFKEWDGKSPMNKSEIQWGLYSDMDDFSADCMVKLDNELQAIKTALVERYPYLDLSYVKPLGERIKLQYKDDVGDKTSLKTIFSTNKAYCGCITPTKAVEGGFIPALQSRLFWEDIPSGLCILKNMAEMMDVKTPNIDFMIEWHQQYMGVPFLVDGKLNKDTISQTATPASYGLHTPDMLVYASVPNEYKNLLTKN